MQKVTLSCCRLQLYLDKRTQGKGCGHRREINIVREKSIEGLDAYVKGHLELYYS